MPDNVDYADLVGFQFVLGQNFQVPSVVDNGDGSFTITVTFTSNDPSVNAPMELVDASGDQITVETLADGAQYHATVVAHSGEAILVSSDELGGYYVLASDDILKDPNWVTISDGTNSQGIRELTGTITVSPTNDPAPFGLACFAEGARIATPAGDVPVESLEEGDLVLTASGEARAIRWIGMSAVQPRWLKLRGIDVHPVTVRAHAFGQGLPVRDLRLSPGHAVHVEGVLVPVGLLVNGATIVQERVDHIRYYHLELDTHDVLLAEGLPCESYLDDGNREGFANVDPAARLDPRTWDDACAPIVAGGAQLVAIQQRLQVEAQAQGWTMREEADLRLVVDGVEIAPFDRTGGSHCFSVPATAGLVLRSCSAILGQVLPGLTDPRPLGVAVRAIRIDSAPLDLDGDGFGRGFYPVERHGGNGWRWTDGEAFLAVALSAPAQIEIDLVMVAPSWTRNASPLPLVA